MHDEYFTAIAKGDLEGVRRRLAEAPARLAARNPQGLSGVLLATYCGKPEVASALIEAGASLDLFEASATGRTDRVLECLRQAPDRVNDYSPDGFFPLALAVFFGHAETVRALLDAGADVNQVSRESMKVAPIQSAAAARRAGIARLLIAHGANPDVTLGENGLRPIHEAAQLGDLDMARALAEGGADLHAATRDGRTALEIARAASQTAMAEYLEGVTSAR